MDGAMGLLAAVVSMSLVSSASAAPVTGSVSDVQDAAIDVSTNLREPDARTVSASYDRERGSSSLRRSCGRAFTNTPARYVNVAAGVSLNSPSCGEGPQQMTVYSPPAFGRTTRTHMQLWTLIQALATGRPGGAGVPSPDGRTLSGRFQAAALVRQDVRCISQIGLSSGDQLSRFCLGGPGCFAPPPTQDTTPPEVAWVTPTDGQVSAEG